VTAGWYEGGPAIDDRGFVMSETVEVAQGTLRGWSEGGVRRFLGVPYAAPPFGERRMLPPQPASAWEGEREALQYGPTVLKGGYPPPYDELLPEPTVPGEDCLNLNVWTPQGDPSGLPVLVWIHGGAFVNGSGRVSIYDGTAFARDGIVCVTINYRLGADGFLDVGDGHTNIGLRDQIAALRWVGDNIAAFGGDPGNVTIAGESAGGMSVTCLLSSPLAAGLFRRVIAQSGAGHHAIGPDDAQRIAKELATRLAVDATREAIAAVPTDRLLAAQAALSEEIQLAPDPGRWGQVAANLMPFEPEVDGDVLPARPVDSVAGGQGSDVDLLVGWNTDEHRLFLHPAGAIEATDDALLAVVAGALGLSGDAVAAYRSARAGASPGDVLAAVSTDWFFRIPAVRLAEARASGPGRTYMYEFAWRSPVMDGGLGACHALELPFVFDTLAADGVAGLAGADPPQSLADAMHAAWVAFIRDGDPGWAPYDEASRSTMRFDTPSAVVDDPYGAEREVWSGVR
jgi:para-nitrobenzyl esterase